MMFLGGLSFLLLVSSTQAAALAANTQSQPHPATRLGLRQADPTAPAPLLPRTSAAPQCLDCTVNVPLLYHFGWTSYTNADATTTLTAVEVITIVNSDDDSTTVTTKTLEVPSGFKPPDRNADGTIISTVTYLGSTTILTFPTTYVAYDSTYSWTGTLATTSAPGITICSTAKEAIATLSSHPVVPDHYISDIFPKSEVASQLQNSPFGDGFIVSMADYGDPRFFSDSFPDEVALQKCNMSQVAPETFVTGVHWLTKHKTVKTGGSGTPTTKSGSSPTNVPASNTAAESTSTPSGGSPPNGPSSQTQGIPLGSTTLAAVPTTLATSAGGSETSVPALVVPVPVTHGDSQSPTVSTSLATITPGQTLTVNGTPLQLPSATASAAPSNAPQVVVKGSQTLTLVSMPSPTTGPGALPFTTNSDGSVIYTGGSGTQTLEPGESVTVGEGSKTTVVAVSTDSRGSDVVVYGSRTSTIGSSPTATGDSSDGDSGAGMGRIGKLAQGMRYAVGICIVVGVREVLGVI